VRRVLVRRLELLPLNTVVALLMLLASIMLFQL
jgi:hypothetical protein